MRLKLSPQRFADIGWAALVIAFTISDFQREDADIEAARTHVNGTTFSATWRRTLLAFCRLLRIPTRYAKYVNLLGLLGLGIWLYRHIGDHLDTQRADW